MNMNRLRPTEADKDDLEGWLAGVVNDALRDVTEAGLNVRTAVTIVDSLADMLARQDIRFDHERKHNNRGIL